MGLVAADCAFCWSTPQIFANFLVKIQKCSIFISASDFKGKTLFGGIAPWGEHGNFEL